jgi:pimeloyl-ACP methyl ester carboxylesterase
MSRPADPRNIDSIVDHFVKLYGVIGSPAYPTPPQLLRDRIGASVRRSYRPAATVRQLAAIMADADRSSLLPRITAPTLVIHGSADPLVPVACGRELSRLIAGAKLDVVDGMGHDLPQSLWSRFRDGIAANASLA